LPTADAIALEAADQASAHEWTESALKEPRDHQHNFSCHAGKASFVINPTGEMNVCLVLSQPAAQPLETSFAAAWQQLQQFVDAAPSPASECSACDALAYCGRCPAWSLMETGTLTDPVPYLCEIAYARKAHYERPS
jgi:radical SAM protein with 4Fe4S-binding SPASM domain